MLISSRLAISWHSLFGNLIPLAPDFRFVAECFRIQVAAKGNWPVLSYYSAYTDAEFDKWKAHFELEKLADDEITTLKEWTASVPYELDKFRVQYQDVSMRAPKQADTVVENRAGSNIRFLCVKL
jgi:hypothetical protein